ncbi:MAG: Gx transporter family protein [Chitinispirillaceae bacterium]|nr:Gx transporter family protein [Chitinispirillaceae bacterium]
MTRKVIDRMDPAALLAALSVFLSSIEYAIPKPLPFLRIGIANLALLVGLRVLPFRRYLVLLAAKTVIQGLLFGTLFSYVFVLSACGTFASGLAMFALDRLLGRHVSLIGISVAGAFASNAIQLAVAGFIFLGRGAFLVAPPFLLVGTVTSLFLGLFAERFVRQSVWVKQQLAGQCAARSHRDTETTEKRGNPKTNRTGNLSKEI